MEIREKGRRYFAMFSHQCAVYLMKYEIKIVPSNPIFK